MLRELKRSGEGVISTQVLQEYCNVALRKLRLDSGCVTLYSEDLNTGDVIHCVTLINPFSR